MALTTPEITRRGTPRKTLRRGTPNGGKWLLYAYKRNKRFKKPPRQEYTFEQLKRAVRIGYARIAKANGWLISRVTPAEAEAIRELRKLEQ